MAGRGRGTVADVKIGVVCGAADALVVGVALWYERGTKVRAVQSYNTSDSSDLVECLRRCAQLSTLT